MNPFFNERERRPRALWRLLFQYAVYQYGAPLLTSLTLGLLSILEGTGFGADSSSGALASPSALRVVSYAASLVMTVLSIWLAGRFLDRRPFSGFGLRLDREWLLDLLFGLFLGALLMSGIFFVEFSAGWISITGTFETVGGDGSFLLSVLAPAAVFLCVGIGEEMVSRGYQLQNIAEGLNHPILGGSRGAVLLAWLLSSAFFGLLHLGNANATIGSTVNVALAGLLLGAGYVLTGRLAIPIGLHITWNFFQGNVFGFPVSGTETIGATFVSIEQGGPPLWTGGPFGPEAGLLTIAAVAVGTLLIWLYVRVRSGKSTVEASIAEPPASEIAPSARETPPGEPAPGERA